MSNNSIAPLTPIQGLRKGDASAQIEGIAHDSAAWIQAHWLEIVIAAGIGVGIFLLLHAIRSWAVRLCRHHGAGGLSGWPAILGRTIAKTGNFFIVMTSARLVIGYANAPLIVNSTVIFLFTIAAVFQAAVWVREIIFGLVEQRTAGDSAETLASAMGIIRLLVTIALFAVAIVVVLSNLGVNVTGLVAGLGVGGIAIGLAAQGIFADLFAALAILFDRPFRIGDVITYDNTTGTVEEIGLKSTRLRSFSGEVRIIANKNLLDKELQNITARNHIRISFMLGLAYHTDPDKLDRVPQILKELIEAEGATVARNGFAAFSASTLDYEMIFDVPSADWNIAHPMRDRLATAILRRFKQEGIELAFPTQTTFTAAPDGTMIMPYPDAQPMRRVDGE